MLLGALWWRTGVGGVVVVAGGGSIIKVAFVRGAVFWVGGRWRC